MSSNPAEQLRIEALRTTCLELDQLRTQAGLPSRTASGWSELDSFEFEGRRYRVSVRGCRTLTPREVEVVGRVLHGDSNKVIAYDLGLAWSTVRVLVARITRKLGVRSRAELVARLRNAA